LATYVKNSTGLSCRKYPSGLKFDPCDVHAIKEKSVIIDFV
jgi:hypothetical protein